MIRRESVTADALVVPGDFANRSCPEGLNEAWNHCLEIAQALHARHIVPVIGNHDIDSKRLRADEYVFERVQNLRTNFPFPLPTDNSSYFAEGYCALHYGDIDYIALNTVIGQTDEASAKRGTFSEDRISKMEAALTHTLRAPIRVAVMHHHPILHSAAFWADRDVLPTGDLLVATLRRMGCRVIIHGHKHVPRLQIVNDVAIFASGSFSAMLHEYGTAIGNTFHVMNIQGEGPESIKGEIFTWTFQLAKGWHRSSEAFRGFPYSTGFGAIQGVAAIAHDLIALAGDDATVIRFEEDRITSRAPELRFLSPDQTKDLRILLEQHGLKLMVTEDGHIELGRVYQP
jgi:predicted phosphodiesterase